MHNSSNTHRSYVLYFLHHNDDALKPINTCFIRDYLFIDDDHKSADWKRN